MSILSTAMFVVDEMRDLGDITPAHIKQLEQEQNQHSEEVSFARTKDT